MIILDIGEYERLKERLWISYELLERSFLKGNRFS
jgi:hypothetical protein